MLRFRSIVWASLVMLAVMCAPARAATLTVTNINDSGAGSLRATLTSAASGDTIGFGAGVTGTIPLLSTLTITQPVTIQGPGAAALVLDGQTTVPVFTITTGTLSLSGVTVANGKNAGLGGGANIANGAALSVSNCIFSGNSASNGGGIAVIAGGVLTVDACTFHNNTTTSVGGGAIISFGTATVSNSTFVGNTAPVNGGAFNVQPSGILNLINDTLYNNSSNSLGGAISNLGTLTIINDTFAANQGSGGAAIATGNSTLTIYNSVFTDNAATSGTGALSGDTPVASNNVFYNNTDNGAPDDLAGYGTTNFISAATAPLTGLGNYGGPTQTMLPLPGRAAVCAGSIALLPVGLTLDQRGFPRTTTNSPTPCVDAGSTQSALLVVPTLSTYLLVLLAGLLALFGMRRVRYGTRW